MNQDLTIVLQWWIQYVQINIVRITLYVNKHINQGVMHAQIQLS